jgi:hypothetical protein
MGNKKSFINPNFVNVVKEMRPKIKTRPVLECGFWKAIFLHY